MAKPTILLITGAWIPAAGYTQLLDELATAGYPTQVAMYPSFDPVDPSGADCAADTAYLIDKTMVSAVEQEGKDVVLLMHSYASMPGLAAAKGYSKTQRAKDQKNGGVVGMVCMSAFLVPEGVSCSGAQGGSLPPWILLDNPALGINIVENPGHFIFGGVPAAETEKQIALLKPHANLAFNSPQPPLPYSDGSYDGRLAYIVAAQDFAVPKAAQQGMMAGTRQKWIVREMECGHNAPFLTHVAETVAHLENIIGVFEKA